MAKLLARKAGGDGHQCGFLHEPREGVNNSFDTS